MGKAVFSPIPPRAIGDERLSALDLRVMMAIAVHDRMSKNGVGCTAGHGRLAGLVGCHLKSLSRSIRTLAECGYVGGRANPLNPRSRCYFVIYNEFDNTYLNAVKGNEAVTYPEPIGNQVATPQVTNSFQIGNQPSENPQSDQEDSEYNIFSETVINPVETVIRNPVETATISRNEKKGGKEEGAEANVGTNLARLERSLKRGDAVNLQVWAWFLNGLVGDNASLDHGDPNYHRAQRLLETIGDAA